MDNIKGVKGAIHKSFAKGRRGNEICRRSR